MSLPESRRITGPHLLLPGPGAAVELSGEDPFAVAARARLGAERLGWKAHTSIRDHRTGATVALSAPADLLYTACAVLDWAVADVQGVDRGWDEVERERAREENPVLRDLLAIEHSPVFMDEDFGFTVGLGRHSRTWPPDALPTGPIEPRASIPFVFLTGTNGKTTTTRMLARIASAAGFTPGWTSSDAYGVGQTVVESGDWTGPGAARAVLRNPEVDFACLETARGGLLRRGLVIAGARAAVVTNISSDHIGEYGIHDELEMARAKLGVAVGVAPGGTLILNAANPWLRQAVGVAGWLRPDLKLAWFADRAAEPPADRALDAWAEGDRIVVEGHPIELSAIPSTFEGTVRHNVENALAAALAARACGIGIEAIAQGLAAFEPSVAESRGRMNKFTLPNGAVVLVDFAHNPDGVARVGRATARWPFERRTILLGQAGDRSDADLAELARTVADLRPDTVVLKEMKKYYRGRPEGEVSAILRRELIAAGYPESGIATTATEGAGVQWMIDRARPGDLLLMLVQADLDAALAALAKAGAKASIGR